LLEPIAISRWSSSRGVAFHQLDLVAFDSLQIQDRSAIGRPVKIQQILNSTGDPGLGTAVPAKD
jgi:hypothetical protein